MPPLKILNSKDTNDAFWSIFGPKSGRFLFFGILNGEGGAAALAHDGLTVNQHIFKVCPTMEDGPK